MKKALVVVTNISKYPEQAHATGLWLGEVVHFVDEMEKEGYKVDYVSPKGGNAPIDPQSLQAEQMTELDWDYYSNNDFLNKLGATLSADEVNAEEYAVIYYAGGHGVMWDFPSNEQLQSIAGKVYENGGIISTVCHGSVGLLNIKDPAGNYLIANKKVAGFANTEEIAIGLDKVVPFLTEDELVNRGAHYVKGDDWTAFAVADDRIVTGQNPASGAAVAKEVLQILKLA